MGDLEEDETFQRRALEVTAPGPDFDPTRAPQDGEEFLTHMMYERQRCPAVVVAKDTKQSAATSQGVSSLTNFLTQNSMENTVHTNLLPTKEWKMIQVQDFLKLRNTIEDAREAADAEFFSNATDIPNQMSSSMWKKFCCTNEPLLRTILQINNRALEKLLEFIADWFNDAAAGRNPPQDDPITHDDITETTIDAACAIEMDTSTSNENEPTGTEGVEAINHLSSSVDFNLVKEHKWLGQWLYATMTCLHLPLEPTVFSTLRNIARTCLQLRNRLQPHELETAQPLNMFICLIASVFDQFDFKEFV